MPLPPRGSPRSTPTCRRLEHDNLFDAPAVLVVDGPRGAVHDLRGAPMTRLCRMAAIVLTLAAAGLATTAQTDAHAASPVGDARAGMPHTRLHVHVTGCDRCTVTLQHAVSGQPNVWTSAPQRVGADHVATFRVRTSRTHGMSFVLRA